MKVPSVMNNPDTGATFGTRYRREDIQSKNTTQNIILKNEMINGLIRIHCGVENA